MEKNFEKERSEVFPETMSTFGANNFDQDLVPVNIVPLEMVDGKKPAISDFGARKKKENHNRGRNDGKY